MSKYKLAPRPKTVKICSVENCNEKHSAKGFCGRHYTRIKNLGSIHLTPKTYAECAAPDCQRTAKAKTFCFKHWRRNNKHGSPEIALRNWGTGKTFEEKFWSRVAVTANPDKCWNWIAGTKDKTGLNCYGIVWFGGNQEMAHRVSFCMANGYMPKNFVLHSCDNPRCVNPNHLREGTHLENMRDMMEKGRGASRKGVSNGNSKLTETQIKEIRGKYKNSVSVAALGATYGVQKRTIYSIVRRKSWKHI